MRALERLFASRAARIGMIILWLILGGLGGSFAERFQNIQKNEESSFLPGSSESVKELALAKRFPSGERFAAIAVIRREGGLTRAAGSVWNNVLANGARRGGAERGH